LCKKRVFALCIHPVTAEGGAIMIAHPVHPPNKPSLANTRLLYPCPRGASIRKAAEVMSNGR